MPKSINLTGKPGTTYDLEDLQNKSGTRTDSSEDLIVQIWYWNPEGISAYKNNETKFEAHKYPNPPNPKLGQIWLSKRVPTTFEEE